MPSSKKSQNRRRTVLAEAIESRILLSGATYIFGSHTAVAGYDYINPNTGAIVATPFGASSPAGSGAITPAQMEGAYGLSNVSFAGVTGNGAGQTIAIVDAGQDPNALSDLETFDAYYNLPNPPSFQQLSQAGSTTLPGVDPGWPGEESLDVQWSHSMAPDANIILFACSDLYAGVQYAASYPGVSVVSMSFGISGNAPDSIFVTPSGHTGVAFFGATGDVGSEVGSPAQSVNVVAVGGTDLNVNGTTYSNESAWSAGGGGISGSESQPAYQSGLVSAWSTTQRTIPDVSMDADPGTGVAIVDSYDSGSTDPWEFLIGGTSLSTPLWAGTVAVADQGRVLAGLTPMDGSTQVLPRLYELSQANYTANFHDVTSGNNGHPATAGYDLATGIGSPVANVLLPDLAGDDTISGQAFIDNNGNGTYDAGTDTPLANKTVYLDLSNTGEQAATDPTATTNASGQYTFTDVIGGWTGVVRLAGTSGYMPETTNKVTTAYDSSQTYNLVFGSSTTYTATASPNPVTAKTTQLGVTISGTAASGLTYAWETTSIPFGATPVISSSTAASPTINFNLAGTYIFTAKITDSAGQIATTSVSVVVSQTASSIILSPNPANISTGGTQQITETALDQFGNALTTQPNLSTTWSLTTGLGSVSTSGLYTAPTSGGTLAVVKAVAGSFTATETIGVVDSPWASTDIGSPSIGGYAYDSGSTTTIVASGAGIAGTSDQFHLDYQTVTGNATLETEVTSLPTGTGAQAGIMFRNSSSATASFVDLVNTSGQGLQFTYRNATTNTEETLAQATAPSGSFYLKLSNIGTTYVASYSTNGTSWTQMGIYNNASAGTPELAGLAASSDTNSALATATFSGTILSQPTIAGAASAYPAMVTGTTTTLSVLGANTPDTAGQSSLTCTWAPTSLPARAAAPTFSVNGTNAAQNTTVTFYAAGTYTFTATIADNLGDSIISTVTVTVNQTYTSIAINPTTPNLNANSSETFAATAVDQFGSALSNQPAITWSLIAGPGSINSTGVFTATATTGTATVEAISGVISQTSSIIVIPPVASPVPTVAAAASASPNPSNFTTASLSVLGADDSGESNLTCIWTATTLPAGATAPTFSINGTNAAKNTIATFSAAGSYTFTATISDGSGHTVSSTVSMTVNQSLTSITVAPGTISVDESGTQTFTATGHDQFGAVLAVQPVFNWSVSGGIGSVNSVTGIYTAPTASGSATVLATSGTITASATVTITSVQVLYKITASDFNTTAGVLTDEIAGLTANEAGNPTIAANATPSGQSALVFNGANSFNFTTTGPRTQDETIFAVVKPSASMASLANGGSIIGGSDGNDSVEYRLIENSARTGLVQQLLETGVQNEGNSSTIISTSAFTIVEVTINEDTNVSNFYTNGVLDSSTGVANNLASGPTRVGARQTGGSSTTEYFIGDIAEVDIYGNAISASDSAAIEAQLAVEYLTPATRTLTSIVITPGSTNLHEGATQTFTAIGYDQYGVALASQPAFTWSETGAGSIGSSTGVYTAPAAVGISTVKVTSGSISTTATVSVNHGVPTIATAAAASPGTVTGFTTALSVLGADSAGESSLFYTWTATTLPSGATQPTFSINGTNSAKNNTATFFASGTYVFNVTAADNQGAGTASSSVTVIVSQSLTSIAISPASANLHESTAQTFIATAEDQFGLPMSNQPAITWSLETGIGSINPATGVYTAPAAAGSATVQASSGGVNGIASVTVSNSVPTVATPASATPSPVTGTTVALSALGADDGGAANLTYTWSATALPAGAAAPTFSLNGANAAQNTTAAFTKAGGYTFTVTITDTSGNSVTSSISVAVSATLSSIVITPTAAALDESMSQPFSAMGYDQFGAVLASQPAFTWSETGGGSINSSTGLYVAPTTTATVTVKATSGSISKTAAVTVAAPALVFKVTASDYNTTSGALKDEVAGLTGSAVGAPTITADDTPSGASAITFNGANTFNLNSTGPYSQNQTIFAVIKPSVNMYTLANGGAIIGGAQVSSVEYRLIENSAGTGLVQQDVQTNTQNLGEGSDIVTTAGFSVVELVLNQSSDLTTFYDDGIADPTTGPAANISTGASRIGARQTSGSSSSEFFIGDIAEIDIYNSALSASASAAIESQLSAEYLTAATAVTRQLTSIVVSPSASNLHEDATQSFTATGYDQFGAALSPQPVFTWSSTGIGSVSSTTGLFTAPAAAGNATVTVTSGGVSQSAAITITNAAPTVATAAAANPATVTGTSTALTVLGTDDNGESNLTYTWAATTIPSGAATPALSQNGTNAAKATTAEFHEIGSYTFTVTISDGQGKTVTSSVNVIVSPTLSSIAVSPSTVTLNENTSQAFSAVADDQFGAALANQPAFVWSNTGVGSITSSGVYTAPNSSGTAMTKASSGAVSGTASVTVNSVPTSYNGSTGSDAYAIRLSPTDSTMEQIFVNTPETGTPTYTIAIAQLSSLAFNTASDGSLAIDFANGNPLPANGVSFTGGAELLIDGSSAGGLGFAINAAQVTDAAAVNSPIAYSSVSAVMFDLSGGSNTLTQQAQPDAAVTYNAGAGSNTLTVNGGTYTFSADPQSGSGNLTVNDNASVVFSAAPAGGGYAARNLYALNLTGSATAAVVASTTASDRTVLETYGLSIASGAALDLGNNAMIVHGGNLAAISSLVQAGYNGGLWNGAGIVSSSAAGDTTRLTAIGLLSNTNAGTALYSTFDNQPVTTTDILLKETYYGDTNLDGKVDGSDYSRIDAASLTSATGWFNGDFNEDGVIDGSDYTLIDNAFNSQGAQIAASIAAPLSNPATIRPLPGVEANVTSSLLTGTSIAGATQKLQTLIVTPSLFSTGKPIGFAGSTAETVEMLLEKKDLLDAL